LSICHERKWTNASFIEEQKRLHSTIPMTTVKQTKSNKKVRLVTLSVHDLNFSPQF
jgi:hypothetical protein